MTLEEMYALFLALAKTPGVKSVRLSTDLTPPFLTAIEVTRVPEPALVFTGRDTEDAMRVAAGHFGIATAEVPEAFRAIEDELAAREGRQETND